MASTIALILAFLALAALPAAAQTQPYAGFAGRSIKALSAEEVAGLQAGGGMSLALAAELNGYPGPLHALEHAEALRLTAAQRTRVAALRAAMLNEAQALGRDVLAREAALDAVFADRRATPAAVAEAAREAGLAWGRLRAVHLSAHIEMLAVLSPEQIAHYGTLRGYAAPGGGPPPGPHRGQH